MKEFEDGYIEQQMEEASHDHQAYVNRKKNQEIVDRLDKEIRRAELARKLKYFGNVSEREIRYCEDILSLLQLIRGVLQ